ncbi:membrane fusion protein, macrolide-specific efflux system [Paenibacillus catalpae]|uniref:Membrane fusion protein, macrolide-specific efflux system n=1 Tax=Paenibacillus catalpae TaxID=1045775 RepID=A0A1I2E5Z9_9BACL|nr:efflux RND transporter periplasmic adaptor subunit [Paenibacillus catalpae]SFE88127.1 membrane fusion protein, macrolide-specific efflux system [Paenibacillus catalpae]
MLSIRWRTAGWSRNKKGRAAGLLLAVMGLTLLAGCSIMPQEEEKEALPEIRVPKISQKPEYPVTRKTLELKATGSGKLLSAQEENLFFEMDNRRITDVYVKAGDKVNKGQVLAELDLGDLNSQIRRKEIDIEKTELDLKEAMRGDAEAADSVLLRKQQLDYELMKEELAELKEELNSLKLTAPYSGTIISFTAEKGDLARAYEAIGRIADMDSLVVAVQFNTNDRDSIAPGMETIVDINASGEYKGTVKRLPVDDGGQSDSGGEESLDAYTLIELSKLPDGLGRGTPLSASVIVQRKEKVLTIPLAALRTQNSRHYVLAAGKDGSKGEVDVEIGIQTSTDVEIIKGLEEGQKVVGK